MADDHDDGSRWKHVTDLLGDRSAQLGTHWSYNLRQDPKRFVFVLSRYKFAAKMTADCASIIELGCSEGIGAPLLAESGADYVGVDLDEGAIASAQQLFDDKPWRFSVGDLLDPALSLGAFEGAVSLDVVEHIPPAQEDQFFDAVIAHLTPTGRALIGTPNKSAEAYQSEASRRGHVNLFTGERLREAMARRFRHVFLFGLNDEVVHTGFTPMCHYLVALGCDPIGATDG
jgi:predicted O-methyltransferase YrrM